MKKLRQEPLKNYTTLYIGGPARELWIPENPEEIARALQEVKERGERLFILGRGSNVLFMDEGFDGIVLCIPEEMNQIELLDDNQVKVQAGASNKELAAFCVQHGLSGYEFACGVPGSIGGAVVMNAGCYDSETKNVLKSVEYLDEDGNLRTKTRDELDLGYRHSWFTDHFGVVVSATYQFEPGNPLDIQAKIDELQKKRYEKQPMEKHSCGSTFKRPEGYFAGKLIQDAGLRGYRVGDAMVSEKHTGFLINDGNASAAQFVQLVKDVQKKVKDDFGVDLECEVKMIPAQKES